MFFSVTDWLSIPLKPLLAVKRNQTVKEKKLAKTQMDPIPVYKQLHYLPLR